MKNRTNINLFYVYRISIFGEENKIIYQMLFEKYDLLIFCNI